LVAGADSGATCARVEAAGVAGFGTVAAAGFEAGAGTGTGSGTLKLTGRDEIQVPSSCATWSSTEYVPARPRSGIVKVPEIVPLSPATPCAMSRPSISTMYEAPGSRCTALNETLSPSRALGVTAPSDGSLHATAAGAQIVKTIVTTRPSRPSITDLQREGSEARFEPLNAPLERVP
jgi:hypothetical protein